MTYSTGSPIRTLSLSQNSSAGLTLVTGMGFILLAWHSDALMGTFQLLVYSVPMNSAACAKRLLWSLGLGAAFRYMLP